MIKAVQSKTRKPHAGIYLAAYLLVYPLMKLLFRLRVDKSAFHPPEGAFVVLSNHQSYLDFLAVMLSLYPYRMNAVAAQKFFLYRPLNRLLPLMGAIPKNLFDPDLRSIKAIIEVVRRGDQLLLFPEGRCSVHGLYMGIHKATAKLIKLLKVPVYSSVIEGAYTCMPFWRKLFRRGHVRVTLAPLFTQEEARTLSVDDINSRIDARLSGRDRAKEGADAAPAFPTALSPQVKPLDLLKARKLAEGLEHLIYYCPRCEREFSLETFNNTIRCTVCGNTATLDKSARLISSEASELPATVAEWYQLLIRYENGRLSEEGELARLKVFVKMPQENLYGLIPCGRGEIALSSKGWRYEGELSGEAVDLFFPIDTVPAVPFDPNDSFQIYSSGNYYTFVPVDNPSISSKYAIMGECAYWRFASNVQMTPGHLCEFSDA